jgi:hypothetical protein
LALNGKFFAALQPKYVPLAASKSHSLAEEASCKFGTSR